MKVTRSLVVALICIATFTITAVRDARAQAIYGPVRYGPPQSIAMPFPQAENIARPQLNTQWCWAACVQMLAASQSVNLPQTAVVAKIYGTTLPNPPSMNFENICIGMDGIYAKPDGSRVRLYPAYYLGNNGFAVPLVQSLKQNRPFIIGVGTHAMVAYGASWSDIIDQSGRIVGVQMWTINMIDPMYGFGKPKYSNLIMAIDGPKIIGAVTFTANQI